MIKEVELTHMLTACLKEYAQTNAGFQMEPEEIQQLITKTFQEVDQNNDGKIDFEEYKTLVERHPAMLDQMTVNVSAHLKAARDMRAATK